MPGALHAAYADARTERDAIGFRRTAGAVATAATAAAHGGGGQGPVPRAWLGRIRLRTHPGRDPGRRAGQRRRGRPESHRRACACHHKIGFRGWTLQCHAVLQGRGAAPGPTARDAHPDSRVLVWFHRGSSISASSPLGTAGVKAKCSAKRSAARAGCCKSLDRRQRDRGYIKRPDRAAQNTTQHLENTP